MLKTGELSLTELKNNFRDLSLRELSLESARLAAQIEENPDDQLSQTLKEYLEDLTADKIDGTCWYADYLKSEIELWQQKKANLALMCARIIELHEARLKALEQSILHFYSLNLIDKHLIGKNRAIEVRNNSKSSVMVLVPPEHLPEKYQALKVTADKDAILRDYQQGFEISLYAQVETGQHVRFKTASRRRKQ